MRQQLKIVFFNFTPLEHSGGAELYFTKVSKHLSEHNNETEVTVVTAGEKLFNKLLFLISIYYRKNVFRDGKYRDSTEAVKKNLGSAKYFRPETIRSLRKVLYSADVVYTRNELVDLITLKLVGYKKMPPVVMGVHTPVLYPYAVTFYSKLHNKLYSSIIYRNLFKGVSLVKVSNKDDMQLFKSLRKDNSVKLLYHPHELPKLVPKTESDIKRITFAGRLTEQKGVDIVINVIKALNLTSYSKGIEFRIAGDGDKEIKDELIKLSDRYKNVKYLGHLPKHKMQKLMHDTDIVIVPSRYETVNQVVLEACANECVVIASDIPGPKDIIVKNETGYLVKPETQAFTRKLIKLINMPEDDFKKIGREARKRIGKTFSPEKYYQELWTMLCEVAKT